MLHVAGTVPLIALTIDFIFNNLVFGHHHIIVNLVVTFIYLFAAFIGSAVQRRPVYANHLGFFTHRGIDWNKTAIEKFALNEPDL